MKLWLDDVRPSPEGWTWAKTRDEAIESLRSGAVTFASLDHDLGPNLKRNGHGYDVVVWMIANDIWPTEGIVVHSWNLPAGRRMADAIDRYGPYATRCQHIPYATIDIGRV